MTLERITPQNVCACLPARYASHRLHGKLLFDIGGQSVLERTCRQVLKCKWISRVYILTDHERVANTMSAAGLGDNVEVILNKIRTRNGTERIGRNLSFIPEQFEIIVNIQGDEPFVDPRNIDYVIQKHVAAHSAGSKEKDDIFFSTLHQRITDLDYLQATSCVKIIVNRRNNAMLFTRNVVPWNKDGIVRPGTKYFSCTGLYVYNRSRVEQYIALEDTQHQLEEDVEQMKVLEHGFVIKTFEAPYYNEISVNTVNDYEMLREKYGFTGDSGRASPVSSLSGTISDALVETEDAPWETAM
ncbi:3-deoxy-manno-octulosonate cytidylyltransferase [Gracilariopsis chorda]|uniref:3-deoxy-manno-octulosonate cytidylyltransferase n=1 Tax=Gracilariopsis chorda TaxID=448386 RepID=A0A2V3IR37_9FLOR|nr:3-deoxy-manno-octulosonate cytidylyltransferase [Gracilariopsis chorda]|eukprot:PXF44582.1 3-deoxy-manno-octulosonate cytidylyltransferase [Gracilariopsis chorda]